MSFDINIDWDEDEFTKAVADHAEAAFLEYVENEVEDGHINCDCGSQSFDIQTWEKPNGEIKGAAVCRECNDRIPVEVDLSDLEELR